MGTQRYQSRASLRGGDNRPGFARKVAFSSKQNLRSTFGPPENWYDPQGTGGRYKIVTQSPGDDYVHVVTPAEIRRRLADVPSFLLANLEVVQLSRMTRKKEQFPCYGLQWGTTIYLYPLDSTLVEWFDKPPEINIVNETKMYGGIWDRPGPTSWRLTWTEKTLKDFYLNNVLIHELGHIFDDRNTNAADRERYADWFAIHYGYLASGGQRSKKPVKKRHHK